MKTKSIWKSKTLWVNLLLVIIAIVPEVANLPNLQIPKEYLALLVLVANVILRLLTDTPVSLNGSKE